VLHLCVRESTGFLQPSVRVYKAERVFATTLTYPVHLLGFEFEVRGLAFQQQDRAVAACATTAIWCAMQRAARFEGGRAPTPSAITEAAVKHFVPLGRPFPSAGLTVEQICEALRRFEFAPIVIRVAERPGWFLTFLHVYLASGIPPILAIATPSGGHALASVGHRESSGPWPMECIDGRHVHLENRAFGQVYVHDDRIGPYARASIVESQPGQVLLHIADALGSEETSRVELAIVPLYPKIRTSAFELAKASLGLLPAMTGLADGLGPLGMRMRFTRSGAYMSSLYCVDVDAMRLSEFLRTAALSRYVGVTRWFIGDRPAVDAVWDTTDTSRTDGGAEALLALVSLDRRLDKHVDTLADEVGAISG